MPMPPFHRILTTTALCLAAGGGLNSCQPCYLPREIENPRRICVMKGETECLTLTLDDDAFRKLSSAISRSVIRVTNHGRLINVRPANEEYYSDYHLQVFGENESRSAALYTIFPFVVSGSYRELSDESACYSYSLDFEPLLSREDKEKLYQFIPEWRPYASPRYAR